MRKLNKRLLTFVATTATVVASLVASSACWWYGYQPEEPKCLQEK